MVRTHKTNRTIWKISRTFLVTWSVFTEDVILSVDVVAFLVENSYLQVTKCSQTNQMESINTKWIERQPQLCQFCTFCSLRFGFIVTFARNLVYLGIVWKSRSDLHHSRGLITTWVESGFGGWFDQGHCCVPGHVAWNFSVECDKNVQNDFHFCRY